jgi:hypothetical protein
MSCNAAPSVLVTTAKHRERSLSLGRKKPFSLEFLPDLLERLPPQTVTGRFDPKDPELKLAATCIHRQLAERRNRHSLVRRGKHATCVRGPHHAPDLRVFVLEREVPVPLAMLLETDDFTAHPERLDGALDDVTRRQRQGRDRDRALW